MTLAGRELKARYKQTALGVLWVVAAPLATVVTFTLVFNRIANVPSEGLPYPVFAFIGLVGWSFVASALTSATASLVASPSLLTKVALPRYVIPLASVLAACVDCAAAVVVLVIVSIGYGLTPSPRVLLFPVFLMMLAAIAAGTSLIFSALNVQYRDVRVGFPFMLQLWLFLSPVAYSWTSVHGNARMIYFLNPMAGALSGLRWSFAATALPSSGLVLSIVTTVALLAGGWIYFAHAEARFADVV
jgi:ABC-type polysaccharide/polyol phosphate export permease